MPDSLSWVVSNDLTLRQTLISPPLWHAGLDLEGFDPWTLDSVAAFSSLDGSSCSESSVADFDPTAWLQL